MSEGEDVVAKRLVFGHAVEGQSIVSNLLDIHCIFFTRAKIRFILEF